MNGPPERLPAGTGVSLVSPDPQVLIQTVAVPETHEPKQKYRAYKNEKDIHRHALDYYFLLGKERRLEKVAEKFKVSLNAVQSFRRLFTSSSILIPPKSDTPRKAGRLMSWVASKAIEPIYPNVVRKRASSSRTGKTSGLLKRQN